MSFIEEITPYIERIKLHQSGNGRISNIEDLRAVRDIHFKYLRSDDFSQPSNLGCNNCVRQMINQLVGMIDRELLDNNTPFCVDAKKIRKEVNTIRSCKKMTFPKEEPLKKIVETSIKEANKINDDIIWSTSSEEVSDGIVILIESNHKKLKWGAFKKYCTKKGLKVPKKTREMLEAELKGL